MTEPTPDPEPTPEPPTPVEPVNPAPPAPPRPPAPPNEDDQSPVTRRPRAQQAAQGYAVGGVVPPGNAYAVGQ